MTVVRDHHNVAKMPHYFNKSVTDALWAHFGLATLLYFALILPDLSVGYPVKMDMKICAMTKS
jgi:hypothetical protein